MSAPPASEEVAVDALPPAARRRRGIFRGQRWREYDRLLAEMLQVRGLMPLLLKHRHGDRWTREERAELRLQLRALSHLVPYLVLLALPGSVLLLPLLAWRMERQERRRQAAAAPPVGADGRSA
jgi:hypothetical protein